MENLRINEGTPITPQLKDSLPHKFTNPFSYTPHELTLEAMDSLCAFVKGEMPHTWQQLQQDGKMMGVLVAEGPQGELGYLAAFSGVLDCPQHSDFFVPPVYNINSPDSFFPSEESLISGINARIKELQEDKDIVTYSQKTERLKAMHLQRIAQLEEEYRKGKAQRDSIRCNLGGSIGCTHPDKEDNPQKTDLTQLIKQSQFQKAQIRRAKQEMKGELEPRQKFLDAYWAQLEALEQERKERSIALQKRIFEHFIFLNAKGERKSLLDIFGGAVPPAGAGECAAPRLLQYAYKNGYRPVAMGEFWLGAPTANRQPLQFYPSCKAKCAPILGFMLQGLDIEEINFHSSYGRDGLPENSAPEILYEDEYILAVNKPAGILSQPGKDPKEENLLQLLRDSSYTSAVGKQINACGGTDSPICRGDEGQCSPEFYLVHRLDMHTSGVLLLAKNEEVYKKLQRQFEGREVEKCYYAVLDGEVSMRQCGRGVVWNSGSGVSEDMSKVFGEGFVSLPLMPDYENRPLQKVDFLRGKEAVTHFRVKSIENGRTYIEFYPITGRTHQLRVHSASADGLNAPIVGDLLYGKALRRLMLHAHKVKFQHPYKGAMEIVAPLPQGFEWR